MKFLSIRIILLVPIAVFGAGFLFIDSVQAQPPDNLVVQFETAPLFNKTNFLPDDAVSRWVKVTNNSGESRRIATEAINKSDPDDFASQLNLTIKEGATVIFNDTLKKFFSQGETYLSDLANGTTAQYDFTIVFNSGSGNEYQLKSLGFDILVGFEGQEGGLPLPTPGGGANGGGGLPPGLTIQDESVRIAGIEETSITLIWNTSYLSSSQVIYGAEGENHILNLTDNAGAPPKYGYAHTTPEYDIIPKVISHSVTIYGLTPSTTYYYRAVSHASLAISREYSFTTLGVKEIGKIEGEVEVPPGE
ncbi:MAG: fibronectin type III domain-containing protein, partial [bacterium]|nr:fibronectin type III domain-containing protein [bacterium]